MRLLLTLLSGLALTLAPAMGQIMDAESDSIFAQPSRSQTQPKPSFSVDVPSRRQQSGWVDAPVLPITGNMRQQTGAFVTRLTARDLQVLGNRDVILLIDKSGSMSDKDCPPPRNGLRFLSRRGEAAEPVTRWDWCENELTAMAGYAAPGLPNGMRVVLFSNRSIAYNGVRINQVNQIFRANYPEGTTNATEALKTQLDWFLQNRAASGGRSRPVVIAVITDGLPNNSRSLKKVIIDATAQMQMPDEVAITFLQVGFDKSGISLVHQLDDNLTADGARFDIVDCKDFHELTANGLGRALIDAINEASMQPASRPGGYPR